MALTDSKELVRAFLFRLKHMTNIPASGTPLSLMDAPQTEEEHVAFVDTLFDYLQDTKRGHEYHWREALLMIAGEQWLDFDPVTGKFSQANLADWIPTPTTNKLGKIFDRGVDLFTSGDLKPRVRPATDDQRDIDTAQVAQRILLSLFDPSELNTAEKHRLAAGWLWATGNTILKSLWNPRSNKTVKRPRMVVEEYQATLPNGQMLTDDFGEPYMAKRLIQQRDPDTGQPLFDDVKAGMHFEGVVSPFNFFPEVAEDPDQVTHAIETEVLTLDMVKDLFGSDAAEGIEAEEIDLFGWGLFLAERMIAGASYDRSNYRTVLKTFRSIPTEKFPNGKTIITAGKKLLFEGDLEGYLDGKLPWEHVPFRRIPGDQWGISPLRDAIPLQKRLNAIDSAIVQNRKLFINPQIIEPKGANMGAIDGRAGARLVWDWTKSGGHAPVVKKSEGLHPSIFSERETVSREMEDVAGTVEILSGNQPSGVDTFGQTQLLAEQALRRFAPPVRAWKRGLANHERRKLMIARAKWTDERTIRIIGENEDTEVYHYKGADIGNANDVYIGSENAIIFSESFEQQKIVKGIELGLVNVRDPAISGKVIDLLGIPGFANQYTLDAKMTRRRIKRITENGATVGQGGIAARFNDNHAICYQVLSDFTKTAEYEDLNEQVQQNLMALMQQHQQAMQQQQQQAMQAAEAVKGTDPRATKAVSDTGAFGAESAEASQVSPTI